MEITTNEDRLVEISFEEEAMRFGLVQNGDVLDV